MARSTVAARTEIVYTASQWKLITWSFTRHKAAMVGAAILAGLYATALFAEFMAPYDPNRRFAGFVNSAPQQIRVLSEGAVRRPFVYAMEERLDLGTFRRVRTEDTEQRLPIRWLVRGAPYRLFGIFESRLHLFGVADPGTLFLLGTDGLGRDLFSRIVHATRLSLSVGLLGVAISFVVGCVLGSISGYFGGAVDNIIQRVIEIIRSIPTIPLWMGLSAALPANWPIVRTYFAITIILSLVGWTSLARVVRGKFLEMRESDHVTAARVGGAGEPRIIFRHMLPGFTSYLIVDVTLALPNMILGETALSFLGLGLRPPALSWGVLLQDAQNIQSVSVYPWLLMPAVWVIVSVIAFNFLGDGLRDAADPYQSK